MTSTQDTVALPPNLEGGFRRGPHVAVYRGTVIADRAQAWHTVENGSGRTVAEGNVRELWLRLPSGLEKRWALGNASFGVLPGHRVSIASAAEGADTGLVFVNHDTGERFIPWKRNRSIKFQVLLGLLTLGLASGPQPGSAPIIVGVLFLISLLWWFYRGHYEGELESLFAQTAEYMAQTGPA
jgi:hypothetical protein